VNRWQVVVLAAAVAVSMVAGAAISALAIDGTEPSPATTTVTAEPAPSSYGEQAWVITFVSSLQAAGHISSADDTNWAFARGRASCDQLDRGLTKDQILDSYPREQDAASRERTAAVIYAAVQTLCPQHKVSVIGG
jgi:hypothetical protein